MFRVAHPLLAGKLQNSFWTVNQNSSTISVPDHIKLEMRERRITYISNYKREIQLELMWHFSKLVITNGIYFEMIRLHLLTTLRKLIYSIKTQLRQH